MSLNNKELALFTKEFKELLPIKIEKLYIPEENILLLTIYKKELKKHLLIEVGNNYSGLYFIKERPKQNLIANIQSKFRNLLLNGLITDIEQINNDRILKLTIKKSENQINLILELTGRHGNIFITQENIIEALLLLNKKDKKRDLSLYSKYQYPQIPSGQHSISANNLKGTFLDYLENEYAQKIKELKSSEIENQIKSQINRKIKKLKNKKKNLLKDLDKLNSYKNYKNIGELLKANLYQIKRGMKAIEVTDYYNENMPTIEIKLESSKTPIENMEFYFKKHEKYKRGVSFIKKELKKIENSLLELEYEQGDTLSSKLQDNASLYPYNEARKAQKIKKTKETHIPYKTYLSSSGFKILVGKKSIDNDYLTFKVASGNDIWLHVLSYSGSHVIIKKNNKKDTIDINTIYEAAHLAILNSKAPSNDSVEVCYTFRKFVKKPPKSKPGAVIYTQEKRLYLQLNKKVVDNLKFI